MESESFEEISATLRQIDIENEPGSEKNEIYSYRRPRMYKEVLQQKLRRIPLEFIDFELYIKENCKSRIRILNRAIFYQIQRPIIIIFNHFNVKCAYHVKWLDELYQLALIYGDHIEFIAADMIDIDVMYPGRNPITFFNKLVRPECEFPKTFAIDEKKRIYETFISEETMENLSNLCGNLINDKLFISQPMPENNETNLVKICVANNYKELILDSPKYIFLVIGLDKSQPYEPDYNKVALALRHYNLDIVYMEAEKNYIPFEYNANCFPTLLFIPFNDKSNFIYYHGCWKEENIIEFLKKCIENTEYLQSLQQQQVQRQCSGANVAQDFILDFNDLPKFLKANYKYSFKVLDRHQLDKARHWALVVFMSFQSKCSSEHVKWLNKLYPVVEARYGLEIFVADFEDIDIINTKWKPEDLRKSAQGKPQIYGFDRLKNTYAYGNFDSMPSLFYFIDSLQNDDFFYSQEYTKSMANDLVKIWNANYLNKFLKNKKHHFFISFYSSDNENTKQLSALLEMIATEVQNINVEVVKFDVRFNYLTLEYAHDTYPVHYFIHKDNKRESRLYVDTNLDIDGILRFIRSNI